MTLLVGADPELFITKDGKPVSAHGVVTGTKTHPFAVPQGAVQVDGMALEFNIDPSPTQMEFVYNIHEVMKHLRDMVPKDFDFSFESVAYFDKRYIENQPEEAQALGCDPDYDAYTEEVNTSPDASVGFRTAAGHIHLGWKSPEEEDDNHFFKAVAITKQLDYMLGLPSLILDRDGLTRRSLYGKAGAFRPKPYGAEYRVLSNFWLHNEALMSWVFTQTKKAFTLISEEGVNYAKDFGKTARNLINCDAVVEAEAFMLAEMPESYAALEDLR